VLSSGGVLKWSKVVVGAGVAEFRPSRAAKFDYVQREKLYYTREEKGYRNEGRERRKGAPRLACNPAYRPHPRR